MRKNTRSQKLKISKEIIFRQLSQDDGILLNLSTKNYYSLNGTACFIVKSLIEGSNEDCIVKDLKNKFGAAPTPAKRDLRKTLEYLSKENILL